LQLKQFGTRRIGTRFPPKTTTPLDLKLILNSTTARRLMRKKRKRPLLPKSAISVPTFPLSSRRPATCHTADPVASATLEVDRHGPAHTLPVVAQRLECSVATVRRRIDAGDLVAVQHGRIVRVLETDLQRFILASRKWR
jgi:excisionase family DNA binding protein